VNRVDSVFGSDVVVVGGGIAGLTAALGLNPRSVTLVTKNSLGMGSSSRLAQGGVAAAVGKDDSPAVHARDTLLVGGGLSDHEVVELITAEGPLQINRLLELGASFDADQRGDLLLGKEAAHSRRRIVHARGDGTGAEIVRVLVNCVSDAANIRVFEESFAADLVFSQGRVAGLLVRHQDGSWALHRSTAVIVATGGIGSLFARSTNPPESTGDGLAMAARAGARLADLEFVQFHPTALACDTNPMPLLTEALRGEGAILIDANGARFMKEVHPDAELAPRDVVSRTIWRKRAAGGEVFLDATEAVGEHFPSRFPSVFAFCQAKGYDPRVQPIPVSPAAHYHIGGIHTDSRGRSSLPGLWACGEVAATHLHGANRLASNSLLEALVFGARVAQDIERELKAGKLVSEMARASRPGWFNPDDGIRETIRKTMWDKVGLIRCADSLSQASELLSTMQRQFSGTVGELANMVLVGQLIARAALQRTESRGVHFRSDYPKKCARWEKHIFAESQAMEGIGIT
jgi:L-aspartate oxidase